VQPEIHLILWTISAFSALTLLVGRQEGYPARKKIWGCGGGGHWLVWMEWRPAGWSVCLSLLISPCTIKSRSSLRALSHPGGPRKRAVKRLCVVCVFVDYKTVTVKKWRTEDAEATKKVLKLHSMRWFSHQHRTSGRHNCITYLLMDIVAWPTATPAMPAMLKMFCQTYTACKAPKDHAREDRSRKSATLCHFFVFVDLDFWPPNSNSGEIFVQCTHRPTFQKLSCWQTDKLTNKQMPLKTSALLRYAMPVGN